MLETRRGALLTSVFVAFWCLTIFGNVVTATEEKKGDLVVLTPYRKESDGLARFLRSAKLYGYKIKVLGEEKAGEDAGPGDEELLSLLKEELKTLSEDPEKIVLYTEGANSVLSAGPVRVVEEFERSGAAVLVSADGFCWPDRELEGSYPKVKRGKRFLNSGGIVGRAEHFHRVLSEAAEEKSLQMLLTHAYIKDATRDKYNIRLDHLSNLFQNLNGATGDVELRFAGKEAYLQNTLYNSVPVVVTGNGHTGLVLNTLGSYLARAWNPEEGCRSCWDDMITLDASKEEEMPAVALGVFVEKETPFLEEFLEKISNQVYPKEKIHLFVHNSVNYHEEGVSAWAEAMKEEVASVKYTGVEDNVKEWHARNAAIDFCLESESQYFFSVDSEAHIDNPYTIKLLIEQNRDVVAPMLIRPYKAWSNFWGAITSDGFYARSMDYMEIVQGHRRGLWNVPYITSCYLVRRHLLEGDKRPAYIKNLLDPDMAFCENLREKGVFMYVSNRVDFGHLVNADQFDSSRVNPELWQVVDNRWDWEQRYLHPNYSSAVAENATAEMPCPDVYWFPLFKERYAQEMIQTFEDFGVWSAGTNDVRYKGGPPQVDLKSVGYGPVWQHLLDNYVIPLQKKVFIGYNHYDPRLEGGYESVPTIDIHMKQIGMEAEWLEILRVYVQPMQLKVFEGYYNDVGPPRAIMNFMVRYKPDEQPFLRPHHDTSTYTINVALNKPGVDYKGGGCRFVRYNCSVTDSRVGWILMHPGRLTHLHEGLPTTEGTRYIIVSFVDP